MTLSQSIQGKMTKQDNKKSCSLCSKSILGGNLARHMQTHNAEKSFVCTICDKSFDKNQSLKNHMFQHSNRQKNFKCKECSFSSSQATNLKDHMQAKHEGAENQKSQRVKMEVDVYSGMNFMFEEDIKVEEDIKREVEDINLKLKVEVEDVKIGKVQIEDEALLGENNLEEEAIDAPGDLLEEKVEDETRVDCLAAGRAKGPTIELCDMSMLCQREEVDFCQETFDLCFLRTVALAERHQRIEKETKEKLGVWV